MLCKSRGTRTRMLDGHPRTPRQAIAVCRWVLLLLGTPDSWADLGKIILRERLETPPNNDYRVLLSHHSTCLKFPLLGAAKPSTFQSSGRLKTWNDCVRISRPSGLAHIADSATRLRERGVGQGDHHTEFPQIATSSSQVGKMLPGQLADKAGKPVRAS